MHFRQHFPLPLPIIVLIFSCCRECLHILELYKRNCAMYMLQYKHSFNNALIIILIVFIYITCSFLLLNNILLYKDISVSLPILIPWGHLCHFQFGHFCKSSCEGTFQVILCEYLGIKPLYYGINHLVGNLVYEKLSESF